ncbi:MAG: hypothetical protein D6795_18145 [Deltaproteobacteria bacterium]|nr:MAG: hypothetical protein D6795_18145 [Deltaproteobacteria bacterium]
MKNARIATLILCGAVVSGLFVSPAFAGAGSKLAQMQKKAVTTLDTAKKKLEECKTEDTACHDKWTAAVKRAEENLAKAQKKAKELAGAAKREYEKTCAEIECTQP